MKYHSCSFRVHKYLQTNQYLLENTLTDITNVRRERINMQYFIIKAFANRFLHYSASCGYLFFLQWSRLKFFFQSVCCCYLFEMNCVPHTAPTIDVNTLWFFFFFFTKQLPINIRVHCQVSTYCTTDFKLEDSLVNTFFLHYHLVVEWCDVPLPVYFQAQLNALLHHLSIRIPFPDFSCI